MATAIQLELVVDEKGAVQGVRAFDASVKGTTSSVHQLNDELTKTAAHADGLKQLERQFTANEGSIRTMNAEVRSLQGSIFGDTRAASEFLATLPKIGEAMELAFPVFGATALIGVLVMGAQKIHEFYEKWIDVDGAVRKYQIDAMKAAQTKLFDEGAMESQIAMMGDLNAQIDELQSKQRNSYGLLTSLLLGSDAFPHFSVKDAKDLGELLSQQQMNDLKLNQERYQARVSRSQDEQKVAEARVPEYQRPGIEKQYDIRRAGYLQEFTARRDMIYGDAWNTGVDAWNKEHPREPQKQHVQIPADDGSLERQKAIDTADADFQAKELDRKRSNSEEIRRLNEQAIEARLQGEAQYYQKSQFQIEELERQGVKAAEAVGAVNALYDAQRLARLKQQELELEDIQMRAAMSGMTGVGKIQAEGQLQIGNVMGNDKLSPEEKSERVAAIHEQTNNQILQAERDFTQQIDALSDQSAEHQISGFARIRADAQKQLDALKKSYESATRDIDVGTPEGAAAKAAYGVQYQRGRSAINAGAGGQAADLARRNEEETEQIETQARAKLLSAEKQQTDAIQEEYNQRLAKYRDELNQQLISTEDYNRRVVAAGEEMQAELIDQARQAREKIAGELKGVISAHPLQALQEEGSKLAAQAGAAMIQRIGTHYHVGMGGAGQSRGSIFDRIAGIRNPDEHAETPGTRGLGPVAGMMTLRSATIYITGTATIAGGGGGVASAGGSIAIPNMASEGAGGFAPALAGGGGGFGGAGAGGGGGFGGPLSGGGSAPSTGGGVSGILHNIGAGVSTVRSIGAMFGKGGGGAAGGAGALEPQEVTLTDQIGGGNAPAAGASTTSAYGQSMLGGGMTASNTLGGIGAGVGLFSAFKTGGFGGMMGGAMSGAELGMDVGGPIGAAIGAVGGAALGFFGGGEQARVWWLKNGRNRLHGDMLQFEQGGMDYTSAYTDMEQLKYTASETLKKMGFTGERYYHDTVTGEISAAEAKLNREEKGGRSASPFSGAMFATGIDSVPAMLSPGERVVPTDQNERITRAIESFPGLHSAYRDAMQTSAARASAQGGDTYQLHIHALDAKSFNDMLKDNADGVRSATNLSFQRYGGIADFEH